MLALNLAQNYTLRFKFTGKMAKVLTILSFVIIICGLSLSPGWAVADEITLAWDPNSEPDLAGYRLYVQEDDDGAGFRLLATIALTDIDPQAPRHTVLDLMPDTRYRFTITAYNQNGDESGLSNTVCVINGQQCVVSSSSSSSGCFIGSVNTPSALKTPAPAR
jgi:chitinase